MHQLAASSPRSDLVDLQVPFWAWGVLGGVIVALLAFDLYRHRDDHAPTTREAFTESAMWVGCGLLFGAAVAWWFGGAAFGEYLSGYLIEKSLSVDNVFVWAVLFGTMAIPLKYQHRVLFWGIFGALVLRALFIALGGALLNRFTYLLVVFGVFLVWTGIKLVRHHNESSGGGATRGLDLLRRLMPVSEELDGHNFFTRINGRRAATPLLAALVVVELTDVVFAVDSVPAILAVSNEPFIVFSSNAFAILGMRAMYFLLADARQRFELLSYALGGILVFVGAKMAIAPWFHLNTWVSLAVIVALLTAGVVGSQILARRRGVAPLVGPPVPAPGVPAPGAPAAPPEAR